MRDERSLNSAINRSFATFDQQELYPEPIEKAAAILESIVTNHLFIDGNKRTGYALWVFENHWQKGEKAYCHERYAENLNSMIGYLI